jgi:hypothetical protein
MSDGGKGDKPRPIGIPIQEFDNRWDMIFKKPKEEHPKETKNEDNPSQIP